MKETQEGCIYRQEVRSRSKNSTDWKGTHLQARASWWLSTSCLPVSHVRTKGAVEGAEILQASQSKTDLR